MSCFTINKKGVLQLALQLHFHIVKDTCNSLYLYVVNANGQVAWVVELQFTIYTLQLIATQLQLSQNNSFSITIQLHYNYTHDVMLMSLLVVHLLKFDMWHYEDFWTLKNLKYWSPSSIMIVYGDLKLWHMAQLKTTTWHINCILDIYLYISSKVGHNNHR